MNGRYDCILVGGGLVGPALALVLARHGFRVAVLDPLAKAVRADPGFDGRAYAMAPGSQRLLTAIGLWADLAPHAQPIRRIEVSDAAPGPIAPALLSFDPQDAGASETGWMLEDRYLRGALLTALDSAGVDHIAPATVTSVERTAGHAIVHLADGQSLTGDLVVAADGRRSATAQGAGIGYVGWEYGQTGLVGAIAHEGEHGGIARQRFFPGGPFAILPLPGRRSALVWSERTRQAARIAALDDAAYLDEVARRVGPSLGTLSLAGQRGSYPLGLALAERYVAPRLALAGDAAHGVHPIAGQGLNMGLRDVAALAEVLVEARRLGEDIGAPDVLARYQQWRRFDASAMALGMDGLNRLFSRADPGAQALRNLGLATVGRLRGARRFFLREAAGAAGDVPRLLTGRAL